MRQRATDIGYQMRCSSWIQLYKLSTRKIHHLDFLVENETLSQRQEEKHTCPHVMDSQNTEGLFLKEYLEGQGPWTSSLHLWCKPFHFEWEVLGLSRQRASAPLLALILEVPTTRHKYCNCFSDAPVSLLGSTACLGWGFISPKEGQSKSRVVSSRSLNLIAVPWRTTAHIPR